MDEAICELCDVLKWGRLKTLDLRDNPFGEQGAKSLADVIEDNPTLEELEIWGCDKISDGVMQYLMDAMRSNTTLKILTLSLKYKHLVPLELVSRVRVDIYTKSDMQSFHAEYMYSLQLESDFDFVV